MIFDKDSGWIEVEEAQLRTRRKLNDFFAEFRERKNVSDGPEVTEEDIQELRNLIHYIIRCKWDTDEENSEAVDVSIEKAYRYFN